MVTSLTDEDAAREILGVMVHQHAITPGKTIRISPIMIALMPPNWPPTSADAGINYAQTAGWIEPANSQAFIKLTQAGFDEA